MLKLIKPEPTEGIIAEIQDLKRKISEIKQSRITEESAILLQIFDAELSEKIKTFTYYLQ